MLWLTDKSKNTLRGGYNSTQEFLIFNDIFDFQKKKSYNEYDKIFIRSWSNEFNDVIEKYTNNIIFCINGEIAYNYILSLFNKPKLISNNPFISSQLKIPFLPFLNNFQIKNNNNYEGTYITPNTNKKYVLLKYLNNNEIKDFYIMSDFKDYVWLLNKTNCNLHHTFNKTTFFKNVKTIKYIISNDVFEYWPQFLIESLNSNKHIELIYNKNSNLKTIEYIINQKQNLLLQNYINQYKKIFKLWKSNNFINWEW